MEQTAALLSDAHAVALPMASAMSSPLTQPAAWALYSPELMAAVPNAHYHQTGLSWGRSLGEERGRRGGRGGTEEVRSLPRWRSMGSSPVVRAEAHAFAWASDEPPPTASGICVSQTAWRFVLAPPYVTPMAFPPASRASQCSGWPTSPTSLVGRGRVVSVPRLASVPARPAPCRPVAHMYDHLLRAGRQQPHLDHDDLGLGPLGPPLARANSPWLRVVGPPSSGSCRARGSSGASHKFQSHQLHPPSCAEA